MCFSRFAPHPKRRKDKKTDGPHTETPTLTRQGHLESGTDDFRHSLPELLRRDQLPGSHMNTPRSTRAETRSPSSHVFRHPTHGTASAPPDTCRVSPIPLSSDGCGEAMKAQRSFPNMLMAKFQPTSQESSIQVLNPECSVPKRASTPSPASIWNPIDLLAATWSFKALLLHLLP